MQIVRHLIAVLSLPFVMAFFGINAVYIPILEEPQLKQRFGADYIEYCRHVPRLLPRLTPWQPSHLKPLS